MNFVDLEAQAEIRLFDLFEAPNDLTSTMISITAPEENPSHPDQELVRVILYTWPSDLVAEKQADKAHGALLATIERRLHPGMGKKQRTWEATSHS